MRDREQTAEIQVWKLGRERHQNVFRVQSGTAEFAGFTEDGRRLLVATSTAGGADGQASEVRVFDLVANQELLEISLGRVIGSQGSDSTAYHFDGRVLRVVGWNEKGGELRLLDGSPGR